MNNFYARLLKILMVIAAVWSLPVHADLAAAKKAYVSMYGAAAPGTLIEEAPFKGWYLMTDARGGKLLFTESLDIRGYGKTWDLKDESNQMERLAQHVVNKLNQGLLKSLRTDWLPVESVGGGPLSVVVISAPNCPYCAIQEKMFQQYSNELKLQVAIVPRMLGDKDGAFTAAVLCGPNPSQDWANAMTHKQRPTPQSQCQKSRWAEVVMDVAAQSLDGSPPKYATPVTIRSDGTMWRGWDQNWNVGGVKRAVSPEPGK